MSSGAFDRDWFLKLCCRFHDLKCWGFRKYIKSKESSLLKKVSSGGIVVRNRKGGTVYGAYKVHMLRRFPEVI